jgi:hypothetical protein
MYTCALWQWAEQSQGFTSLQATASVALAVCSVWGVMMTVTITMTLLIAASPAPRLPHTSTHASAASLVAGYDTACPFVGSGKEAGRQPRHR